MSTQKEGGDALESPTRRVTQTKKRAVRRKISLVPRHRSNGEREKSHTMDNRKRNVGRGAPGDDNKKLRGLNLNTGTSCISCGGDKSCHGTPWDGTGTEQGDTRYKRRTRSNTRVAENTNTGRETMGENGSRTGEEVHAACRVNGDRRYKYFGQKITGTEEGRMVLWYNNINGLRPSEFVVAEMSRRRRKEKDGYLGVDNVGTKLERVVQTMKTGGIDIGCLSETNTAWERTKVRKAARNMVKRGLQRSARLITATSKVKAGSTHKPGGNGIIVSGAWAPYVREARADPSGMGRWASVTMQGRKEKKLTIITAYRVCAQNEQHAGEQTAYMQQYGLMRAQGTKNPNPREQMVADLQKEIIERRDKNEEIILVIDANEPWKEGRAGFRQKMEALGLVNVGVERYGKLPDSRPQRAPRRGNTIDHVLASRKAASCVTKYGMLPLEEDMSDHRPQMVEIDIKTLLGTRDVDSRAAGNRRLQSNDVKATERYVEELRKYCSDHRIGERIKKWEENVEKGEWDEREMRKRYEAVDRDMYRGCISAEKKAVVRERGEFPWSRVLNEALCRVKYWKLRRREMEGVEHNEAMKTSLREMLQIGEEVDETLETVRTQLSMAQKDLEMARKEAPKNRVAFLDELATKYAVENRLDKEVAVREILKHEETREVYQEIGAALKPRWEGQLEKVWIPEDDSVPRREYKLKEVVDKPKDLFRRLLGRNEKHLGQAKNTPFAHGRYRKKLKKDGSGKFVDAILAGEADTKKMDKWIAEYVKGLASGDMRAVEKVTVEVELAEYQQFWRKKRETTATSPFGLHIGHYKAVLGEEDLLEIQRWLMVTPYTHGFVPKRWRSTVQLMLEKDTGTPWITRLRIIELFDAQVNAGLQIYIGRRMVKAAMKMNMLHPAAYGSIPGRTAQDAAIVKLLAMDNMRLKRSAGAFFDLDATGCFDRILPNLMVPHVRRLGLPKTVAICLAKLMHGCKRFVRTKFGVSEKYIKTGGESVLYGIGQGNGGGPAIWLAHLVIMFLVMDAVCKGMEFATPDGRKEYKSHGTGYVDDCTLGVTAEEGEERDSAKVVTRLTENGQRWERLLYTNGGRLEVPKCTWFLMFWKWVGGRPRMVTKADGLKLRIHQTEEDKWVTVKRLDPDDAPRVLGFRMSASGQWKTEYQHWLNEARQIAKKIREAKFVRRCGEKVYPVIWLSKLRYVASIIGVEQVAMDRLNRPVVAACLSASGYHSKMPRSIVYGPEELGGLEWERPSTLQLNEKVKLFMQHVRTGSEIGELMRITMEVTQLQSGIREQALMTSLPIEKYVPRCWIVDFKKKLNEAGAKVQVTEQNQLIKPLRENDIVLMEHWLDEVKDEKALRDINSARLYMKAATLADIVTMDGRAITERAWNMEGPIRDSRWEWPVQEKPSHTVKKLWQQLLGRLVEKERRLQVPLGQWESMGHQKWRYGWYGRTLYSYSDGWREHKKLNGAGRWTREGTRSAPKDGMIPAKVIVGSTYVQAIGQHIDENEVMANGEVLDNIPEYRSQMIGMMEYEKEGLEALMYELKMGGKLDVATDGGLKNGIGTSSYAFFKSGDTKPLIKGYSGEVEKDVSGLTSTREEIRAYVAVWYIVAELKKMAGVEHRKQNIRIVTDSKAAMGMCDDERKIDRRAALGPDMDLVMEIRDLKEKYGNISLRMEWVESHSEICEDEPQEVTINRIADELATKARGKIERGTLRPMAQLLLPGAVVALWVDKKMVNNNRRAEILRHRQGRDMVQYLKKKWGWTSETFELIDTKAIGFAMKRKCLTEKRAIAKIMNEWNYTNKRKHTEEGGPDDKCCESGCERTETAKHVFQCQNVRRTRSRKAAWNRLRDTMKSTTDDRLLHHFWLGLHSMEMEHEPEEGPTISVWEDELGEASREQTKIGWYHAVLGRISKRWAVANGKLREQRMGTRDGKYDGTAWSTRFIAALWTYMMSQWTERNIGVHGSSSRRSELELEEAKNRISRTYETVRELVDETDRWLFRKDKQTRMGESYDNMIAWLNLVRNMYPEECEKKKITERKSDTYVREAGTGATEGVT